MTCTVYGIRLKGEREVRYIGFTRGPLERRLRYHLSAAIHRASYRPLLPWLRANRDQAEIFAIAKCDTDTEARATERVLIGLCLRLEHRLLNGAHVPHHLRLAAWISASAPIWRARSGGTANIAPRSNPFKRTPMICGLIIIFLELSLLGGLIFGRVVS